MSGGRWQRQLRILELIEGSRLRTQGELVDALARDGWNVSQSSVSRDVATLGLVKIDGVYHRPPVPENPLEDPSERRIREGVLTVRTAGDALVVVRTPSGEANSVGAAIDRLAWAEAVGSIAGDDTIFLAAVDRAAQGRLLRRLQSLLEAAPPPPRPVPPHLP